MEMSGCVLFGRVVATPDVAALRATAEVKPPTVLRVAFDATGSRGWNGGIDFIDVLAQIGLLSRIRTKSTPPEQYHA